MRRGRPLQTRRRAREVYESVGQVPVDVLREVDGFILNRLQGALLAEAFRLVGEGYCSPQDLDKTLSEGLGRRWSFMGPFETIELNAPGGIPDYCTRYTGFYRHLQTQPAPAGSLGQAELVEGGGGLGQHARAAGDRQQGPVAQRAARRARRAPEATATLEEVSPTWQKTARATVRSPAR